MGNSVYLKLLEIQNKLKVSKDKKAVGGRYSYRNTDDILSAVKPLLKNNKCNIILTDDVIHFEDNNYSIIKTVGKNKFGDDETKAEKLSQSRYYVKSKAILICCETGDKIECVGVCREVINKKGMDDAQVTGSSSSYARKYALSGLFALDDEKDVDK